MCITTYSTCSSPLAPEIEADPMKDLPQSQEQGEKSMWSK